MKAPARICLSFFPDAPVLESRPIGGGHIHQSWAVRVGGEGSFLLQRINTAVFQAPEALMDNIARMAQHLQRVGYEGAILQPRRTKRGTLLAHDGEGGVWRAFPFIENSFLLQPPVDEQTAWQAARAFGRFTRALQTLPPPPLHETLPRFHDGLHRLQQLQAAQKSAPPERLRAARDTLRSIAEHAALFQTIADLGLPPRIAHHDAKLNNILWKNDPPEPAGVVDWDTTMPGTLLSDFGDLVRTLATSADEEAAPESVHFLPAVFRALEDGYLEAWKGALTPTERAHLLPGARWIVLMQAVRFLTDFLLGDRYYPVRHELHNLQRTRNQLALFHALVGQ